MATILVTGGAGFIGSHTCIYLLNNGYQIYVLDSFINSSSIVLKKIPNLVNQNQNWIKENLRVFKGDLRKESDIKKVFDFAFKNNTPIDAVIHFAGLKAVGESLKNPLKYWDFNVLGTISLLKIMEKFGCNTLVFSSSATIYRPNNDQLINENNKLEASNPYGITKFVIEKLMNDVFNSNPNLWRIINLRYFNPIGAHPSGLIGEDPLGIPNNLFPQITKVAVGILQKIEIYGRDWPTSDGTGVRDYIHVMDLAEGHLRSLEFLLNQKPQILSINLGTGKGTSVLELINSFKEVNNVEIPYSFTDRRKGDLAYVVADNKLAKSILKWCPKRTIKEMCKDGYLWQLNNPRGYQI